MPGQAGRNATEVSSFMELRNSDFIKLANIIKAKYGLNLTEKKYLVESRLTNYVLDCGFDDFGNCEFCFFDGLGFSQETKDGKYFAVYSFYADRRVRARNKCRNNGFAERLLRNQPVFKQHRRSNNCVFLQLFYEKIHRIYKDERMMIRCHNQLMSAV